MPAGFTAGSRTLQDEFGTRALADRIDTLLVHDTIDEGDRAFIEARDMFFLATTDALGRPTCSYKGGEPGFVRVLDEHTLAFPSYDGNGMYLSLGNVVDHGAVGLLFIDLEHGHRMRLDGAATIDLEDPLREEYPEAHSSSGCGSPGGVPELPALHPPLRAGPAPRFVPQRGLPDARARVEAVGLGQRVLPEHDPARDPGDREVLGR